MFWQARPPQCQTHQRHASVAAAAFYSAKSRQGLGLGGLASRGGPENYPLEVQMKLTDKSTPNYLD